MDKTSILIIGGGMAGLATGCYAQMNGYETHILEMAQKPGGVCTSWRRGEYTFDGCLEWLVGTRPGSATNRIWQELGALIGRDVVNHEEHLRVEGRDGQTLIVYTDADKLEQHLRQLAPADAANSHLLCDLIRRLSVTNSFGHESWQEDLKALLPAVPTAARFLTATWQEFAARYTDPFVRDALRLVMDLPDAPFLAGVMMLAWLHAQDAGHPIGGSLAFAQAVEQRYRELGGQITYGARVLEILVDADRAVGVRLADGTELRAERVVSAADGRSTIFDMLHGRYVDERMRRRYVAENIFAPLVRVSLGVARDFSAEPHALYFPLRTPVKIAGQTREGLLFEHYAYDRTLAPAGKSCLTVMMSTEYDLWRKLADEPAAYSQEKLAVAEAVMAGLEERFPGLRAKVEVVDVATPLAWEHHTGNWRGAFEGWLPTRRAIASMLLGLPTTLPGLGSFFMVGQWVSPGGGLPTAASDGRNLVKRLCKEDGKRFQTTVASHPPARLTADFGEASGEPETGRVEEPVSLPAAAVPWTG